MESKSIDAIKENPRVSIEKLEIVSTVVILITGGLAGLLFNTTETFIKEILFIAGLIADFIFMMYLWKLNNLIKKLIICLEDGNNV